MLLPGDHAFLSWFELKIDIIASKKPTNQILCQHRLDLSNPLIHLGRLSDGQAKFPIIAARVA